MVGPSAHPQTQRIIQLGLTPEEPTEPQQYSELRQHLLGESDGKCFYRSRRASAWRALAAASPRTAGTQQVQKKHARSRLPCFQNPAPKDTFHKPAGESAVGPHKKAEQRAAPPSLPLSRVASERKPQVPSKHSSARTSEVRANNAPALHRGA